MRLVMTIPIRCIILKPLGSASCIIPDLQKILRKCRQLSICKSNSWYLQDDNPAMEAPFTHLDCRPLQSEAPVPEVWRYWGFPAAEWAKFHCSLLTASLGSPAAVVSQRFSRNGFPAPGLHEFSLQVEYEYRMVFHEHCSQPDCESEIWFLV